MRLRGFACESELQRMRAKARRDGGCITAEVNLRRQVLSRYAREGGA